MTLAIKPSWKKAIFLPVCVFLACIVITFIPQFRVHQALLSNAILFDLLITAPLVYFLAIRKSTVSKATIARVFIVGVLLAGFILRDANNNFLHLIKTFVSPLVEAGVIFMVGRKFYLADRTARRAGTGRVDFLFHCRVVLRQVTGTEKAANVIASEIAVFYYAFIARTDKRNSGLHFTGYKENGILLILGTFAALFLVETAFCHLLVNLWSSKAAWLLTVFGAYTCLQLFAHIRAVRMRPHSMHGGWLQIHNGLAGDAIIEYSNIEKIELSNKMPAGRNAMKIALIKGLENHNCIIYLKQPIEATKVFGIKKSTDTVLFFVDRPKEFDLVLREQLCKLNMGCN